MSQVLSLFRGQEGVCGLLLCPDSHFLLLVCAGSTCSTCSTCSRCSLQALHLPAVPPPLTASPSSSTAVQLNVEVRLQLSQRNTKWEQRTLWVLLKKIMRWNNNSYMRCVHFSLWSRKCCECQSSCRRGKTTCCTFVMLKSSVVFLFLFWRSQVMMKEIQLIVWWSFKFHLIWSSIWL